MATRELSLFADLDQGRLVQGFLSTLQATLPRFVFGDSIPVSLRPLKSNGNNSANPWSEVDLTGKTVRIAIGNPAGAASSGTFALSYGGDTTTAIAYNAEGATIQTALNALASITSAGGVVVTKATTGAFRVVFNDVGSRTAITADVTAIYPSSGAEIRVAVEGDGSTREIIVARLETLPAAYAELTDDFPVAATSITEVRTGAAPVTAADAVAATGILDASGLGDGDNFTIGAVSFSIMIGASSETEIEPGANETEKAENIISKINAHSTILASATIGDPSNAIHITADTAGVAGNSIVTPFFFAESTLTGGSDAVTGVIGVAEINTLEFTVLPYSGFYTLSIGGEQTLGIPWDADASTIQAALELLSTVGTGMVIVSGEFPLFTINFDSSLGDIGPMTADLSGLVVPKGCSGLLDTNTAGMIELLNGSAQATAKLEIELYDIGDATTWTVLQTECTVIDDVIGNAAASVTGGPEYVTSESLPLLYIGDTTPVNCHLETAFAGTNNDIVCDGASLTSLVIIAAASPTPTTDGGDYDADTGVITINIGSPGGSVAGTMTGNELISEILASGVPPGTTAVLAGGNDGSGDVVSGSYPFDAATAAPPYIRVAAGFLYIREAGLWKKTALSAL